MSRVDGSSELDAIVSGRNSLSSSSGGKISPKVRMRLQVPLQDEPALIVEAPIVATVRQIKMALEIHRGIEANNQTLALWRPDGYKEMDDVRCLYSYQVLTGDRLILLPIIRAGPVSGNVNGINAMTQLAEETTADLLEVMEEMLKGHPQSTTGDVCFVLLRRGDDIEQFVQAPTYSVPPSTQSTVKESSAEETSTFDSQPPQTKSPSSQSTEMSNETMKRKVLELKSKMEESRRIRQSRSRSTDSKVISSTSSATNRTESDLTSTVVVAQSTPQLVCDQCQSPALFNGNGECPRCAGRFCAQHIIRTRHSCRESKRCIVCHDLVLIAGDRYKCDQCQQVLCPSHMKESCVNRHRPASHEKSRLEGFCPLQ